ncbi:MAG: hypothetical protein WCL61_03955, partial [bacterium]
STPVVLAENFKAIATVKSFVVDPDYFVQKIKEGAGYTVNSKGVVLVNFDTAVVESAFDGSREETGYHICLQKEANKDVDCSYTGSLIAFNKGMGLALLKINNVTDVSSDSVYDFMPITKAIDNINSTANWGKNEKAVINEWVVNSIDNPAIKVSFQGNVELLVKKAKILQGTNTFISFYPYFELTKSDVWRFQILGENGVLIDKKNNAGGGNLTVSLIRMARTATLSDAIPYIKSGPNLGQVEIIKTEKIITASGQEGLEVAFYLAGVENKIRFFARQEYLVALAYNYGYEDKDLIAINGMLEDINFSNDNRPISYVNQYSNINPNFYLKVGKNWSILGRKDKTSPILILAASPSFSNFRATVNISPVNEATKSLDNNGYQTYYRQRVGQVNKMAGLTGLNIKELSSVVKYKLNKNNWLKTSYTFLGDKNNVLGYSVNYNLRSGDRWITIGFEYVGTDKKLYTKALSDFEVSLKTFTLR